MGIEVLTGTMVQPRDPERLSKNDAKVLMGPTSLPPRYVVATGLGPVTMGLGAEKPASGSNG